jgi:hypothetical protein
MKVQLFFLNYCFVNTLLTVLNHFYARLKCQQVKQPNKICPLAETQKAYVPTLIAGAKPLQTPLRTFKPTPRQYGILTCPLNENHFLPKLAPKYGLPLLLKPKKLISFTPCPMHNTRMIRLLLTFYTLFNFLLGISLMNSAKFESTPYITQWCGSYAPAQLPTHPFQEHMCPRKTVEHFTYPYQVFLPGKKCSKSKEIPCPMSTFHLNGCEDNKGHFYHQSLPKLFLSTMRQSQAMYICRHLRIIPDPFAHLTHEILIPLFDHHKYINRQQWVKLDPFAHLVRQSCDACITCVKPISPITLPFYTIYIRKRFYHEHNCVPTHATKPLELNHYPNHLPKHIVCRPFFHIIRQFIPEHLVPTYATKPLQLNHYLNHLPTHISCRLLFYIIRQLTQVLRLMYIRKRFYHERHSFSPPTHKIFISLHTYTLHTHAHFAASEFSKHIYITYVLRPIYIRKHSYHEPTHIFCWPLFYIPEHFARQTRNLYFDQLKKTKHTQIGEVDGVRTEPSTGTAIS